MSEKNGKTGREADPELLAMSRITRILSGLSPAGRLRVIQYLTMRLDEEVQVAQRPEPLKVSER